MNNIMKNMIDKDTWYEENHDIIEMMIQNILCSIMNNTNRHAYLDEKKLRTDMINYIYKTSNSRFKSNKF